MLSASKEKEASDIDCGEAFATTEDDGKKTVVSEVERVPSYCNRKEYKMMDRIRSGQRAECSRHAQSLAAELIVTVLVIRR